MGKIYKVHIVNKYTSDCYNIKSFGNSAQEVHKHVLFNVINQSETISRISINNKCVFNSLSGFFIEKPAL